MTTCLAFISFCVPSAWSQSSDGQEVSSGAEHHSRERSTCILLLLEGKAAEPTSQTLQKLTSILRDTGQSYNATESVQRGTAALWAKAQLLCIPVGTRSQQEKQLLLKQQATTDTTEHFEQHLQGVRCGSITSAVFQIKQTLLASEVCALAV